MKRHANIPVFIPHLGCPNQCVFCNQRSISGVDDFEADSVIEIIDNALSTLSSDDDVEIAFFGGSFTGIDRALMVNLLKIANGYIERGLVKSIRCSTRPDYINPEVLELLDKYGVKTVELGIQSCSDDVLDICRRGHSFDDELRACKLVVDRGFRLVGQMMVGLPGSTLEDELATARFIVESGAVSSRIYPTVVFQDTELCTMAKEGDYKPLELSEAVSRSASVLDVFYKNGVDVIRIGLCSTENLSNEDTYYAGPNHPSIGELVESELFYRYFSKRLCEHDGDLTEVVIEVPRGAISKAIGNSKRNKERLMREFSIKKIVFRENGLLHGFEFNLELKGKAECI